MVWQTYGEAYALQKRKEVLGRWWVSWKICYERLPRNGDIVHPEFVSQDLTVNGVLLQRFEVFKGRHLAKAARSVEREKLDSSSSSPHSRVSCQKQHAIASVHTLSVRFSTCRLPYSPPHPTPPRKENADQRSSFFNTVVKMKSESQKVIGTLTENDVQTRFQMWQDYWNRCIAKQEDHSENAIT